MTSAKGDIPANNKTTNLWANPSFDASYSVATSSEVRPINISAIPLIVAI